MQYSRNRDARAIDASIEAALVTSRITCETPSAPDDEMMGVYARYSTSKQHFTSIERQVELCEEYAKLTGRRIYRVYADEARSGASLVGRDGLEAMVRDAKAGHFGVLAIEDVDRLARDLGIASNVFKTLLRSGVSIHVPGRGKLTLTDVAIQGLMGDEGRRMLSERSQFGLKEMAREGRFPTGPCYGYDRVLGKPGVVAINPETSAIVRRIFQLRADGLTIRAICVLLAADGITSKTGRRFSYRGVTGILSNERYIGILVFNRHNASKDPETGMRRNRLKPRSEWIVRAVPETRIIEQEIWDEVRARDGAPRAFAPRIREERAVHLLSHRLVCSGCNAFLHHRTTKTNQFWLCPEATLFKNCRNHRSYSHAGLNRLVLHLIAGELDRPGYVEAYVSAYNEQREKADLEHGDVRATLSKRVDELRRRWRNAFNAAIMDGFNADLVATERRFLEAQLMDAERKLAEMPAKPAVISLDLPRMTALRDAVRGFPADNPILLNDEAGMKVVAVIREFVQRVDVKSLGRGRFEASVTLRLGPLFAGGGHGAAERHGTRVLTGTFHRTRGVFRLTRMPGDYEAMYASGKRMVTDADWDVIRDMLPAEAGKKRGKPDHDPRVTVEAMVFALVTGTPWSGLPGTLFDRAKIPYRAILIFRSPEWSSVAAALAARDPDRFADLPEFSRAHVKWALHYTARYAGYDKVRSLAERRMAQGT